MCNHPDADLERPDGTLEVYDLDLIPLMPLLWERGLQDRYDCQGDPFFVDQTQLEGQRHRAYIMFELNAAALQFVSDIFRSFPALREDKVGWAVEIDRAPLPRFGGLDRHNDNNRLTIRFPNQDIQKLVKWLVAEKDRMTFAQMIEEISTASGEEQQNMIEEFIREETENG